MFGYALRLQHEAELHSTALQLYDVFGGLVEYETEIDLWNDGSIVTGQFSWLIYDSKFITEH